MKEFTKLDNIPIEQLLLDPSNPRFADGFAGIDFDGDVEDLQEKVIKHFENRDSDSGDEEGSSNEGEKYGVNNLITSIKTIGFVPIDKPVVKKIKGSTKYLVIEGNRRVTACKIILREHKKHVDAGLKHEPNNPNKPYPLSDSILRTIQKIDVFELDINGLTDEELKRCERIVLGVRHHGSLLPWAPLPSAYSIYREYMSIDPPLTAFRWDSKRASHVCDIFTLGKQSPKKALRAYVAFRQIRDTGFSIQPSHFSLIQELVTNAKLTTSQGYLTIDPNTFELSNSSLTKADELCQFSDRDSCPQTPKDFKILKDPKSVNHLAKLVAATMNGSDQAISNYAKTLLQQVEDRERPLEALEGHPQQCAVDALIEMQNRRRWVDELERLLARLAVDDELDVTEFGATNDIQKLKDLDDQLEVFRLVFQINN